MNFLTKLTSVITKNVPDTSDSGKVDTTDVAKVLRTSVFIALSSGLAYLLNAIDPTVFGSYSPLVVVAGTALMEFFTKLSKGN